MPVTRSATRAAERSTKSNLTEATQPKAAESSKSSALGKTGKSKPSFKYASQRVRLLEWLSLKDTADSVIPNGDELFCLLQKLYQQKGCQVVARGRPRELNDIEWLIIDLDDATVSSLEQLEGPPHWNEEASFEPEQERSKYPMTGFLSLAHGWMEGKVEYQGQAARRLVYFLGFKDEEGERCYKEEMRWGERIRNGRINWDIMEHFFEDLENLGMIGFDSLHVRFLEVLDYVSENETISRLPRPIVISESAEDVEYYKKLDELYETCDL
ncbi:hypothetical protein N7510_001928 [Penicillium lagena]|uniref:uncharacterized protein n=1 Tax=Penicillium lagena TaxID=94218 RepID=UPI002541DA42|nr:uncharacterized protein N7510_001928 [Penicillium lagena]KAJ5625619.1 hypothetical protein N7510_001928 [Penicillium lagena]